MLSSSSDLPQKSPQIKQEDKFFSRLLAKETSLANSSCRVYYAGAAGAVPFIWESQPGTPKNSISSTTLPPLTPPPSYHFNSKKQNHRKKASRSNLFNTIFPRLILRKTPLAPPPTLPSMSSSSSLSSSTRTLHSRYSSPRSSFSSGGDDEDPTVGSPTSPLCFAVGRETGVGFRGCYSMVIIKNTLLSMVRHGSSHGNA